MPSTASSRKNTSAIVNIIGAGLAGTEAAYQLASRGVNVRLFEMRPRKLTPAHKTGNVAELVCSNTFKSMVKSSASGIFKKELQVLDSLLLRCAPEAQVPAGEALAVDREVFSRVVEKNLFALNTIEKITLEVEKLSDLPEADATIIATGPLTQGPLASWINSHIENSGLYFYDAIAPVVSAESIDRNIAFSASRYGKGGDDYINCPMTREEYDEFYNALMSAEKVTFHDFEEAKYFQGCQPIERIAETGKDALRFGPMKPVGLTDPRTNQKPHAVVQLRIDNISKSAYNLVGFQTKLKYGEQKNVFQKIPGLQNAEFLRLGSMHRNTFISSPTLLNTDFSLKTNPNVYFAGQITGVEGYTESLSIGLITALSIYAKLNGLPWTLPPRQSMLGSLTHYLFHSDPKYFQPVNINFSLITDETFEDLTHYRKKDKRLFREKQGERCIENIQRWKDSLNIQR